MPARRDYAALPSWSPPDKPTEQIRLGKLKAEARKTKMNIEEEDSVGVRQIEADVALQVGNCFNDTSETRDKCAVPSDRLI